MAFAQNKVNPKQISQVVAGSLTVIFWAWLGTYLVRHITRPAPVAVESAVSTELTQPESQADSQPIPLEIETFKPQPTPSTWGEVKGIVESFETLMTGCEGYKDQTKVDCYNFYKTKFWQQMKETANSRQ